MPDPLNITPADMDALTRVVVGEANGEPDEGQAAVAHVVLNRIASGRYGSTPLEVVMAGKGTPTPQFEPVGNPTSSFYTTMPQNPDYRRARGIVDGVLAGDIVDPTNGATNFYAPRAQYLMGRKPPSWSAGTPTAMIGGHVFFAPQGTADGSTLLAKKPPQADNDPAHSMGSTDLPTLAYAEGPAAPAAPPQGTPMGKPAPMNTNDDFATTWGIDPKVMSFGPTPVGSGSISAAPPAASGGADFHSLWGIDRGALDTSPMPDAPADIKNVPTAANDPIYHGAVPIRDMPDMGATTAFASGVQGAPIIGPYVSKAVQNTAAAMRAIRDNTKYSDEQRNVQEMTDLARYQHPTAATIGDVGGALAATAPLVEAAPAAFGISKSPILGRMMIGAGTNALMGGTDAVIRGQDPTGGAALGGLGGAGGPVAGKMLGAAAHTISNRLMTPAIDGMGRPAVDMLTGMLRADTPEAIQANAARLGPNAMLPDLGPSMSGIASGLATKPGDAKTAIFNALEQRQAGADGRIATDLNALLGPAEDPQAVTAAILAHRAATDAANYSVVHGQNAPVDPSAVVSLIDRHLGTPANPIATGAQRTALQNLRNSMVSRPAAGDQPETYHSGSQYFHNLRQEVDNLLSGSAPALGVPQGSVARTSGSLGAVRGALDNALKTQVPGMAHADAASAALAARADAVQQGTSILANGKEGITPTSFAQSYGAMNPGEQIALNKGARGEIDRLVGTKANDAAELRRALQGEGGWNTNKLMTAFGEEPTQGLVNAVGREGELARRTIG